MLHVFSFLFGQFPFVQLRSFQFLFVSVTELFFLVLLEHVLELALVLTVVGSSPTHPTLILPLFDIIVSHHFVLCFLL